MIYCDKKLCFIIYYIWHIYVSSYIVLIYIYIYIHICIFMYYYCYYIIHLKASIYHSYTALTCYGGHRGLQDPLEGLLWVALLV